MEHTICSVPHKVEWKEKQEKKGGNNNWQLDALLEEEKCKKVKDKEASLSIGCKIFGYFFICPFYILLPILLNCWIILSL